MSVRFNIRQIIATDEQKLTRAGLESIPDLRDTESVLGNAFSQDLFTATVTGQKGIDGESLRSVAGPFQNTTVLCALLGGKVYVAEADDRIVGCAVWFPPGRSMYDSEDQQEIILGPLMESFNNDLREWWHASFLPQYDAFAEATLGHGVKHDSWHLQTLAVDPTYQRNGIAAELIETVARDLSTTGGTMVLECELDQNINVYESLKFELILPKGKEGKQAPKREDYREIFVGVGGRLKFPMWVMKRHIIKA